MCPKNCKVTTSTVKLKGETQVAEGSTVILLFSPIAKSTRKIVNYTWLDFLADIGGIFNQYLYILIMIVFAILRNSILATLFTFKFNH